MKDFENIFKNFKNHSNFSLKGINYGDGDFLSGRLYLKENVPLYYPVRHYLKSDTEQTKSHAEQMNKEEFTGKKFTIFKNKKEFVYGTFFENSFPK